MTTIIDDGHDNPERRQPRPRLCRPSEREVAAPPLGRGAVQQHVVVVEQQAQHARAQPAPVQVAGREALAGRSRLRHVHELQGSGMPVGEGGGVWVRDRVQDGRGPLAWRQRCSTLELPWPDCLKVMVILGTHARKKANYKMPPNGPAQSACSACPPVCALVLLEVTRKTISAERLPARSQLHTIHH